MSTPVTPPPAPHCKTCNHWQPKYRGVGECTQEGMPNSLFWVEGRGDRTRLMTFADFNCVSYRKQEETEKNTL